MGQWPPEEKIPHAGAPECDSWDLLCPCNQQFYSTSSENQNKPFLVFYDRVVPRDKCPYPSLMLWSVTWFDWGKALQFNQTFVLDKLKIIFKTSWTYKTVCNKFFVGVLLVQHHHLLTELNCFHLFTSSVPKHSSYAFMHLDQGTALPRTPEKHIILDSSVELIPIRPLRFPFQPNSRGYSSLRSRARMRNTPEIFWRAPWLPTPEPTLSLARMRHAGQSVACMQRYCTPGFRSRARLELQAAARHEIQLLQSPIYK